MLNQFPVSAPSNMSAMAQTDQNRAVAEVQAAMMIAKMNPRDQRTAMDRILNACTRQSLAQHAVYQYARGGTDISGASIRLAEAIAQQWGNIQFGIRELEQRNGGSTVQAFAWDVETNTRREVTFHVPHERHTKYGAKKLTDPQDIYEMVANQGARRLRACILAVIPSDVTESAVIQCEQTLIATADVTPESIKRLVEAFGEIDVSKEQIEIKIQRRLDAIQPAQVANLRKIFASIRDGMSTPDEWFEISAEKRAVIEGAKTEVKPKKSKSNVDSLVGGSAEATIEAPTPVPTPTSIPDPQEPDYSDMPTDLPPPIGELAPEPVQNYDASLTSKTIAGEIEKIKSWKTMSELITGMNAMSKGYKEFFKKELEEQQRIIKASESTGSISPEQWRERIVNVTSREEFTSLEREMPAEIKTDEMMAFMKTREDFCMTNFPELW